MKNKPNFSFINKNMKRKTNSSIRKNKIKKKAKLSFPDPPIKSIIKEKLKKYDNEYFENIFIKVVVFLLVWPIPIYALINSFFPSLIPLKYIWVIIFLYFTYLIVAILFYIGNRKK